jgi:hypothetical protein
LVTGLLEAGSSAVIAAGVFVTVISIARKSIGVLGVLDRAEGLRRMPTSAGRLVGKAGRRLLV